MRTPKHHGDFEGVASTIDAFDGQAPNHWHSDDPHVITTRTYKGFRVACRQPFHFWQVVEREDGLSIPATLLQSQWTSLDVLKGAIDEALLMEKQS